MFLIHLFCLIFLNKMFSLEVNNSVNCKFLFRLCSLSLIQVIIDRPIDQEYANTPIYVVVRMRDSARRVLRSPEITLISLSSQHVSESTNSDVVVSSGGLNSFASASGGAVSIDFICNIQYSHQLTRNRNVLQILLQRRKKYKSKTMNLGFKTLAYCNVDLAQVWLYDINCNDIF